MGMTTDVTIQPFTGTYAVQPAFSTIAFAVSHSGAFRFRGVFADVDGALRAAHGDLALSGAARVASLSVQEPAALRAHLLAPDFFDAERHPLITFRSTAVRLADDRSAEVEGDLTIRGVTRRLRAWGEWSAPRDAGYGEVAGLELRTQVDRRAFGIEWQTPMPSGEDTLGWRVDLEFDLSLMRVDAAADGAP